jgi:tRNA-Thr(GGU) m(6)t(6)A37 methyltransferase TsaA
MNVLYEPVGIIHSCFKEKFGIPRQAGIAPAARAELELFPPYGSPEAVRGLEAFSHIWVIFLFHECAQQSWRNTVRPPRLGGDKRVGVFASRSGFRPNAIGMSAVRLEEIRVSPHPIRLLLSGVDILDQTPVLDIKPYIPYADLLPEARGGFAPDPPPAVFSIAFSNEAEAVYRQQMGHFPLLRDLIIQMLQLDPRPAYYCRESQKESFGTRIYDFEVKWTCRDSSVIVTAIE